MNLLGHPKYLPSKIATAPEVPFNPLMDLPSDYNFEMSSGVRIFKPTARVFSAFSTFLEIVEEIAGREIGVVKVTVPPSLMTRTAINLGNVPKIISFRAMMVDMNSEAETTYAYKVVTTPDQSCQADHGPQIIEGHRNEVAARYALSKSQISNAWHEANVETALEEGQMIGRVTNSNGYLLCTPGLKGKVSNLTLFVQPLIH